MFHVFLKITTLICVSISNAFHVMIVIHHFGKTCLPVSSDYISTSRVKLIQFPGVRYEWYEGVFNLLGNVIVDMFMT